MRSDREPRTRPIPAPLARLGLRDLCVLCGESLFTPRGAPARRRGDGSRPRRPGTGPPRRRSRAPGPRRSAGRGPPGPIGRGAGRARPSGRPEPGSSRASRAGSRSNRSRIARKRRSTSSGGGRAAASAASEAAMRRTSGGASSSRVGRSGRSRSGAGARAASRPARAGCRRACGRRPRRRSASGSPGPSTGTTSAIASITATAVASASLGSCSARSPCAAGSSSEGERQAPGVRPPGVVAPAPPPRLPVGPDARAGAADRLRDRLAQSSLAEVARSSSTIVAADRAGLGRSRRSAPRRSFGSSA